MAYQKLQVSVALRVIPSDYINIPNPSEVNASGRTTALGAGVSNLIDTNATFTDGSIQVGNIVYDTRNSVVAKVTGIVNDNELSLEDGNGVAVNLAAGADYVIYKDTNKACVLYVGVSGDLTVRMANDGNQVTFTAAPQGYQPIQVNRVLVSSTTATDIIALW
jgi:hypothetical protein